MRNFKQKIWSDPVWSKVIAAAIVGLLTIVWSVVNAKLDNVDFRTALIDFWTYRLELWVVAIGLLIGFLIFWFGQLLKRDEYRYDEDTFNLDKGLFERIRTEFLPQNGVIYFLRSNNFAGFSFNPGIIDNLYRIGDESRNSDFEFLHPRLERMKVELIDKIMHFTRLIASETFRTSNGRQTVPPEWELEQPERFLKVVDDLDSAAVAICDKYDQFIKQGRRILKV